MNNKRHSENRLLFENNINQRFLVAAEYSKSKLAVQKLFLDSQKLLVRNGSNLMKANKTLFKNSAGHRIVFGGRKQTDTPEVRLNNSLLLMGNSKYSFQ